MIYKHWNKKKLTALVCAGLMAGTLLPCGIVSAMDVEIKNKVADGDSLPYLAKWVDFGNYYDSIALKNSMDTLVLDLGNNTWDKYFFGGYSGEADAISNYRLVLKSGSVGGLRGGCSNCNGVVTENTVTISGGTVSGQVYGGYSWMGRAEKNTVNLVGKGGTLENVVINNQKTPSITGTVYGGYSEMKNVSENTMN